MSLSIDKSSWETKSFGAMIDSITNRIDNPSESGVDRYVGLEHLDPGSMTVNRWGTPDQVEATKLIFNKGDVIFGRRRAYQKKVSMADFTGICSAHALVLRGKPGLIDPLFLPVFLSSDIFLDRAIKISVGSLSPTVNWKTLATQEFSFPPIKQQAEIAKVFWQFEKYGESSKKLISAAMEIRQAFLRKKWDEFQQFDMMYLSKLISLEYGKSLTASARIPGPYPVVGSTGIVGLHEEFLVEGPVIIIGRKGNAGNVFLINDDCFPIDTSYYVKMISNEVSQEFVFECLTMLNLPNLQESTAIPGLNRNRVYDLMIPVPPDSIQEEFSVTLSKISNTILDFQKEMEAVERLKQKLLEELFGDES